MSHRHLANFLKSVYYDKFMLMLERKNKNKDKKRKRALYRQYKVRLHMHAFHESNADLLIKV
jgi:hypothetical protein